jgi:hypothetical protein
MLPIALRSRLRVTTFFCPRRETTVDDASALDLQPAPLEGGALQSWTAITAWRDRPHAIRSSAGSSRSFAAEGDQRIDLHGAAGRKQAGRG